MRSLADFAMGYSPGVVAPCRDIAQHPEQVFAREATAVGSMKAIEQGVAQRVLSEVELFTSAEVTIKHARTETHALMEAGLIATAKG
jgi:malic enzyme